MLPTPLTEASLAFENSAFLIETPIMTHFSKYHALGNDYLVLDPANAPEVPPPADITRICHRNFGLGSDGILYGPLPGGKADFGLRIFNPDGGEAEKSGNGLRIFARYLYDRGKVTVGEPFTVETPGGVVSCRIGEGAAAITVDMGEVRFGMDHVPVEGPEQLDWEPGQKLSVNGREYTVYPADIGNPHCVIPVSALSKEIACTDGPAIEKHPEFPKRTNVQFLKVLDRNTIQLEIWERGAGYTLASGSSGSAAAAVAHRIGLCDRDITVKMPGGDIAIHIGDQYAVRMTGPATRVGEMELEPEALE
jgi:diaminopimelate epimerase